MRVTGPLDFLARGWASLRLAAAVPERVAAWDLVLLTVTSPEQAQLAELQLAEIRAAGLLAPGTTALAVADPEGLRVGSGTATLHALHQAEQLCGALHGKRVLLIHTGGDSKRLPWANPIGKCFLPLPLLTDPGARLPTLCDQLLATAAPAAAELPDGGLLVLTGDVLPGIDLRRLGGPGEALVITTPADLTVAGRHGAVITDAQDRVVDLLQKAGPTELEAAGAVDECTGLVLIDTGIFRFAGAAWRALLAAARHETAALVEACRTSGRGLSLYEEIAGCLVPARQRALAADDLLAGLLARLGDQTLYHHRCDDFHFWHFGSNGEVLDLFADDWQGHFARRVHCRDDARFDHSAILLESEIAPGACVGGGTLVHACRLGPGLRIGNRCILSHCDLPQALTVPAGTALWQVPLQGGSQLLACIGVDDDPKSSGEAIRFLGRSLAAWMGCNDLVVADLWQADEPQDLWHARLFVVEPDLRRQLLSWMLTGGADARLARRWRGALRLSLAELHRRIDYPALMARHRLLRSRLAWSVLEQLGDWPGEHHLVPLVSQVATLRGAEELALLAEQFQAAEAALPDSRLAQARADLLRDSADGKDAAAAAVAAVAVETAAACSAAPIAAAALAPDRQAECALPVRFDLAGGWSDTPPWCLERVGRVVNLAALLDGAPSLHCAGSTRTGRGLVHLRDDRGHAAERSASELLERRPDLADPFALVHAALLCSGLLPALAAESCDLMLKTASLVPRGSGLGASSILAAAVVRVLQRLAGTADDAETISSLVLAVEQRLGTGGGWQDQIGGLYPGIKCSTSHPTRPLRLRVEPLQLRPATVEELETRLVPVFTGQERLARNVLQIVVRRYLQRDPQVIDAIATLTELAGNAREILIRGDLDRLGDLLDEVWATHQRLDPHCSNPAVDALVRPVEDLLSGWKLAGAGGGGFALLLAKDAEAAARVRGHFAGQGEARCHAWQLVGEVERLQAVRSR